jgi:hypothetical protein
MKDERGKKMWELLICDETRSFEHAEFFPNNRINSVELSKAINRVIVARGRAAHSSTLELNLSRGRERERERETLPLPCVPGGTRLRPGPCLNLSRMYLTD